MTSLIEANFHATFVMLLIVFALLLFANPKIPIASSSLLVLVTLILFFELFPYQNEQNIIQSKSFFAGFGHEALITVCALMIVGQGLVRTGALEIIGRYLAKEWLKRPVLTFLQTLLLAAVLSAFINNTPIVILLLPILISVSLHTKTSSAKTLMPMGFATLIGGMSTSIGTSTNLLVVSVANDLGLKSFQMFDFILPASIAGSVGIIYLWLIAPKLIKTNHPRLRNTAARLFSAQLSINEKGKSDGLTLSQIIQLSDNKMDVIKILRGAENASLMALPDVKLRAKDRLVVKDTSQNLKALEQLLDASLYDGKQHIDKDHPLKEELNN